MKKQILALTAMLAIAGLSSCGPATEKMKVGLLTLHGTQSTYDKNFIDAFNAACDAKGVEGLLQSDVGEDAPGSVHLAEGGGPVGRITF